MSFLPKNVQNPRDPKKPSQGRIILWIVAAGAGVYLLVSGIVGIITTGG